jgi:ketosteroid isomerase-like protein
MRTLLLTACSLAMFMACTPTKNLPAKESLQQQVAETERIFARTMAERDFAGFQSLLSAEAIFFTGEKALRGKQQVIEGWKPFYDRPDALFSWDPSRVEVLDSGHLALSTGPVRDPKGKLIGTFTSIWRLEEGNHWRIIFDKGDPACEKP